MAFLEQEKLIIIILIFEGKKYTLQILLGKIKIKI